MTLVHGESSRMRRRIIDRIIADNLPEEEREWGLVSLDAPELGVDGIAAELAGGSLLASDRVVVLRGVDRLSNSAQKDLARALGGISPGTVVVLDLQKSGDYRRKGPGVAADLRKVFEGGGEIIEASAPHDRQLPTWVSEEAASRGKTMPADAARAFIEIVGNDADGILNELDKLAMYVGPECDAITTDDVRQVVSGERESSVFDLVDAIGKRDARTALSVVPDILAASGSNASAMPLLAMIARQLRLVWQARALTSAGVRLDDPKSVPEDLGARLPAEHNFLDSTKGRSFLVRKYAEQARNFSDVQLVRAMVKVYEADLALKGQSEERMDDRLALETLIVSLCKL